MTGVRLTRFVPLLALAVLLSGHSPALAAEGSGPWYEDVILGVWTIVVFLALLAILRWKAWGPLMAALDKREHTLHGAQDEAQKLRQEAAALREEWQRKIAEIQDQVRQIHDEARRLGERNAAEITAKARADMQAERERLRREIDLAKDQALSQIWQRTADLVTQVSSRAIRRQITGDDQRRLVDDALAELQQAERELAKT